MSGMEGAGRNHESAQVRYPDRMIALMMSLTVLLAVLPAYAGDGELNVHGFASQGYLISTGNNFLTQNSEEGSAEFSEAAVNVLVSPRDRLHIGIQFFARDLGDDGNYDVLIDWAYGDYRWRDPLGIRVGKIKLPLGFYNQVRDLDMLCIPVLLPQSVYSFPQRDFTVAYEGAEIYGNLSLGHQSDVDYQIYGGALNVPDSDAPYWNEILHNFIIDLPERTILAVRDAGKTIRMPWLAGGAIYWNSPLSGVRLGAAGFLGVWEAEGYVAVDILDETDPDDPDIYRYDFYYHEKQRIDHLVFYSAEYTFGPCVLTAEYQNSRIAGNTDEGYYFQASCQVRPKLFLASYYAAYFRDWKDHDGSGAAEFGYPDYAWWQKDTALSLRYDITDNWIFKIEGHTIDGVAMLFRAYNPGDPMTAFDRHWTMFLAKTTFHF